MNTFKLLTTEKTLINYYKIYIKSKIKMNKIDFAFIFNSTIKKLNKKKNNIYIITLNKPLNFSFKNLKKIIENQ